LKYICETGCKTDEYTLLLASDNLECLKYLRSIGVPWDYDITKFLANNGNLECLQYAFENGCPWSKKTCNYAAQEGQIECLQYAYENGAPIDKETICDNALMAYNGRNFECLKYLHKIGCKLNNYYCIIAKNNGETEMLNYLLENGCYLDMEMLKRRRT
jgi:hypothetical protein